MLEHILCVVYFNYCLLFSKEEECIYYIIDKMGGHKSELGYEDQSFDVFIGLDIYKTGSITIVISS